MPWSVESLNARFKGLFGDVRERVETRIGLGRRTHARFFLALGGNGMAKGDGAVTLNEEKMLPDACGGFGESGDGDSGDFGVGEVDTEVTNRKAGARDGERESERRSCRMAEVASTWVWM